MAKDPAFLFYPGDWLSGTMYLSHEHKGAYMDLLILQFNCGKFSEAQAKQVLSICFDVAWPMLKQKFINDGDYYFNARLQSEIEKRKSFTESRRNNAKGIKSIKKAVIKDNLKEEHMHEHMEDENENIDTSISMSLLEEIMSFFNFNEVANKNKMRDIRAFLICIEINKKTEHFKKQFESYKKLIDKESKFKHSFLNFIGKATELFEDGAWDAENWTEKYNQKYPTVKKSKFVP